MKHARLNQLYALGCHILLERGAQVDVLEGGDLSPALKEMKYQKMPEGFSLCRISAAPLLVFIPNSHLETVQS